MSTSVSVWVFSQRGHAGARWVDALERDRLERRDDGVLEAGATARREHLDDRRAGVALQLDVEERPPSDRAQHVRQHRHPDRLARVGRQRVDPIGPTVGPEEGVVVTGHEDPVGRQADVELEAVAGRDGEGGGERRKGVLGGVTPVAAMRQPEGPGRHGPTRSRDGRRCPGGRSGRWSDPRGRAGRSAAVPTPPEPRRGPRCSRGIPAAHRCPSPEPGGPTAR